MTAPAAHPSPRVGTNVRRSMKGAIGYEELGVESSVERQMRDCNAWVEHEGGAVVATYEEDGYSAWEVKGVPRRKRPEFERLIRDVEAGRLDVVLYWRIDRLARGYKNGFRLLWACQQNDARIVSVTEGVDTGTQAGERMFVMLLDQAKAYSDRISAGVRQYHEAMRRAGLRPRGGMRLFGWAPDGSTPLQAGGQLTWRLKRKPPNGGPRVEVEVALPPEADHLREAAQAVVDGVSSRSIRTDWAARGILTTMGRPFSNRTLREVLCNPRNEAILGPELYAQVGIVLRGRARHAQRGSDRVYLLTGLAECGRCGYRLRGVHNNQKKPGYGCQPGLDGSGERGCGGIFRLAGPDGPAPPRGYVDELARDDLFYRLECRPVEVALARASADGDQRNLPGERGELKGRYDELAEELAELEQDPEFKSDPVKQATAHGKALAMGRLTASMREIDRLIREQNDQLHDDEVLEEAIGLGPALRDAWETWDPQRRRDLLEAAGLVRVVIHETRRGRGRPDPSAIERFWRLPNGELERRVGPSPGSQSHAPNPDFELLASSWMLSLRADGYADNTIGTYRRGVSSLGYWLAEHDPEIGPAGPTPDLVRGWLADIPSATAGSYIWGVRHFCRWLVAKGKADRDATEGAY